MHKIALLGIFLALFCICNHTEAKDKMNALNTKEQKIVNIGMYTARGDMPNLKTALNEGLDAGLTVNEIKEVLTQLYAYCGFPRSLNALGNFMALVKEREAKGIRDAQSSASSAKLHVHPAFAKTSSRISASAPTRKTVFWKDGKDAPAENPAFSIPLSTARKESPVCSVKAPGKPSASSVPPRIPATPSGRNAVPRPVTETPSRKSRRKARSPKWYNAPSEAETPARPEPIRAETPIPV